MANQERIDDRSQPGSFLYIERQIIKGGASGAAAAAQGRQFEDLCVHFLSVAPEYRGTFKRIWRWRDWPDNWGADKGIDLVALTNDGKYWAIQAKAFDSAHSIKKEDIDSFLSESSRPKFAYRLLIATTDRIGANAREVLKGQEKPVGQRLRTDLLQAELVWPTEVGGVAKPLPRKDPREDQKQAIADARRGFDQSERGQLIMACGSGKTLTALWIAENLNARLVLLLVPSLSLVGQTLTEWRRSAKEPFRYLVVCSDETVIRGEDATVHSTRDLGVPVTTDVGDVRRFINESNESTTSYVFCTYQSSPVVADAQTRTTKSFDLVIADEAHRCAGAKQTAFGTVLDDKRVKAKRRLFMTATPRYFTGRVKKRAAELEYEIASMDDEALFGPVFHKLTFNAAIAARLLTDYQVVVIGVSDRESRRWAEEGRLVRTRGGTTTDARTLASQIGLAKATRKYDLRRVITFHSSIKKAALFTNPDKPESFPSVVARMGRRQRPSGEIWATHISGEMPAGHRRTLLEELRNLDEETRGFISNCSCLGEGVDVPTLDGIAFIDPKRSMVDIIQAVGRVIRKDPTGKKTIGTIVIPVFVDESADAEKAMSSSAFEPVWQVLRALRAHDQALADELDSIRTKLGKQVAPGGKVHLPAKISIDVPELIFKNFERAFYARAIERSTTLPPITVEKILQFADEHHNSTGEWPNRKTGAGILETGETWGAIDTALKVGNRGLPKGSSLARLLAENRGVRNVQELAPLTKEQILVWVDHHLARTGCWPDRKAGKIENAPSETWAFINSALIFGSRSLPGGSSLAKLLAAERDVRNQSALPALTIDRILEWADAAFQRNGKWPLRSSGTIHEAPHETWSGVNTALTRGLRGLPGGVSLTQLLARERGIRNIQELPDLSVDQILKFADAHFDRTGKWPTHLSGSVAGAPGETWAGIHGALVRGRRGLPGGSSLAKILAKNRGYRNRLALPNLSYDIILAWADSHHAKIKRWPNINSGEIREAPGENWKTVDNTLRQGNRGLPGGSSLAKLLAQERGVKNRKNAPLTIHYILELADLYRLQTGNWPTEQSGLIVGSGGDTWNAISSALLRGARGLPRIGSLAKLLAQERGVRNVRDLPELTIEKILSWADDHYRQTGKWPNVKSGDVYGVIGENWANIGAALSSGGRNLQRVGSLAKLIAKERGARNLGDLPELTIQKIISWADDHHRRTGKWPSKGSGDVYTVRGEKWGNINRALSSGGRGLLGGSSLAILLREHHGAKSESTWESLYNELVTYKKRVGNCDVPRGSLEHRRLSLWLGKQRQNYRNGRLGDDRASKLERLGIRWNPINEAWERWFSELEKFREGYGHCLVSQTEAEYRQLARWVTRQRQDNTSGRLTPERKRRLDDIEFVWDQNHASWEVFFDALVAYKKLHGDTNVQRDSKDDRLARWLQKQRYARSRGKLPEAREVRLAELGVIWNTKDKYWEDMLAALRRYKIANGDCLVPQKYSENTQLAHFVEFQRVRRKKGQLSNARVKELEDLGFVWDARSAFTDKMLAELIAFKEKYGHCSVPQTYEGNRQLAVWVANCRNYRRKGTLDPKLEKQLVPLGFEWRGNRKGVPKTAH